MGHRICDTLLDFCDPDQAKVRQVLEDLEIMLPTTQGGAGDKGEESGGSDGLPDDSDQDSDYSGDDDGDKKKGKGKGGAKKKKATK